MKNLHQTHPSRADRLSQLQIVVENTECLDEEMKMNVAKLDRRSPSDWSGERHDQFHLWEVGFPDAATSGTRLTGGIENLLTKVMARSVVGEPMGSQPLFGNCFGQLSDGHGLCDREQMKASLDLHRLTRR